MCFWFVERVFYSVLLETIIESSHSCGYLSSYPPPKFNIAPGKLPGPNRKPDRFPSTIFSGINSLLNFGGVSYHNTTKLIDLQPGS